ncbi:MAG: 4-hydroxy-3-methylbut-2-enyl diphosphate reductase [Erysipelotrichaceae bacterium]|nr:4-hydroxy-3-methylbut-2-enyl diphosphate reductase [Erysipelotrichaceae bacterium]
MEIIKVIPQGFCKGVIRAIKIAKETKQQYPNENIYILGMIVHNQYVVDALTKLGIKTIDEKGKTRLELLEKIDNGVVILTAHGTSQEVKDTAKAKGLIVVDATCLDVTKTEIAIKEHLQSGYEVFYIGKENHPEANAMLSICPSKIHLIPNETTANTIEIQANKLFLTNQTTMSMMEVQKWIDILQQRYPQLEIQEEICTATKMRQQAIYQLENQNIDCMIIVGDPHSNNTRKLEDVAKKIGIPNVFRIETVQDIQYESFKDFNKIAITSGASTPTYLTNQVIQYLQSQGTSDTTIEMDHLLPF